MSFRDYGIGAQILVALGLRKSGCCPTARARWSGFDGYGLEIVEQFRCNRKFQFAALPAGRAGLTVDSSP